MSTFNDRIPLYAAIANRRKSKVIAYVTGDRPGLETQMGSDVLDLFIEHLDAIGPTNRITLVLYTRGGDPLAAWTLVNLINQFCDDLEILVPSKAMSAGTLLALGARRIIMTKQATLGPIDPSINTPLNPQIPGAQPHVKAPVSVEAVQGYLDLAKRGLRIWKPREMAQVLLSLSEKVHPLVLGQVSRSRAQTRYLAQRLLSQQGISKRRIKRIVDFLSSESGSHDYTLNRREASSLGLVIEKPGDSFYAETRALYTSYKNELQLNELFDPSSLVATTSTYNYKFVRALVESAPYGSHQFHSEGTISKTQITVPPGIPQMMVSDQRVFEGWRKI
jgi:hypothetical protein